jgi:hypothetical protein
VAHFDGGGRSNFLDLFLPMIVARLFSRANATIISAALAVWRLTSTVTLPWKSLLPSPSVSSTMGVLASIAGANCNASSQSACLDAGIAWKRRIHFGSLRLCPLPQGDLHAGTILGRALIQPAAVDRDATRRSLRSLIFWRMIFGHSSALSARAPVN